MTVVVCALMPMRKTSKSAVLLFIALFLFVACVRPTPIAVYVTPTPQVTDIPASQATRFETPVVLPTSTVTPLPGPPSPTVTFIGPVVGPEYTLPSPASATPQQTPTALDTLTPVPTLTPSATETPGGPTPTPLPSLDGSLMGVQVVSDIEQLDWSNTMHRATQLKVGWIKVQVAWELIQANNREQFDSEFQQLELYLQDADSRGFNVLISVAKAPDWARDTLEEDGPPRSPADLAYFLTFFLNRNNLGDRIDAIEVWNEPNLAREWRGRPLNGADYMEYFDAAYQAIRAYSPDIAIITAAPAPTGSSDVSVDDRDFLRQMYRGGLSRYTDIGIGVHPYSWGNPPSARCCNIMDGENWDDNSHFFFADTLDEYRQIMLQNEHDVKLWATEFGWATWAGLPGDPPEVWMTYNSPQDQANYTLEAFEIAQGLDYMGPMIIWNLNLAQVHPELIEERDERVAYSLVLPEGNPQERPLYWMLYESPRSNITPTPGG